MNKKILALSVVFSVGSVNAASLEIDNFNDVSFNAVAPVAGADAGLSSGGFARTLTATSTGDFTDISLNNVGTTDGLYAHSQGAGVFGRSQIDFNLGGLDLNDDMNAFSVQLASADLNGIFGVIVDGVTFELGTNAVLIASGLGFPSVAEFLFDDFAGVNFDSVDIVSLFIDGNAQDALDMTIDNFGTTCSALSVSGGAGSSNTSGSCLPPPPTVIPEPASLALMGLGLGLIGFTRKRKQA